jgi:ribosomal protein S18 acetylase RimI-like enzyme
MAGASELRIERGTRDDVPSLQRLWLELHAHHQRVAPRLGPFASDDDSWAVRRASYEQWLAEEGFLLLARANDELVGYAMVAIHDPAGPEWTDTWVVGERIAEVETLVVDPATRGVGIGSALLDAVEAEVGRRGIADMAIGVVPGNDGAQRLYERRGFRPAWTILSRFGGPRPGESSVRFDPLPGGGADPDG